MGRTGQAYDPKGSKLFSPTSETYSCKTDMQQWQTEQILMHKGIITLWEQTTASLRHTNWNWNSRRMQENPVATKPQQTLLTNMGDLQNTAGTSWHERKGDNIYRTKQHWLSNRGTLPCKHIIKWSWGKENWHSRCQNPKQYKRIKKTATHGLNNSTKNLCPKDWHRSPTYRNLK